jgi:hypothetical protein
MIGLAPSGERGSTPAKNSAAREIVAGSNEEAAMMAWFSRLIIIVLLCYVPFGAMAQQPATAPTQSLLKPAELDQLLAPIALHPDPLLFGILIASTYPLEVVQADRWAKSNQALKADALATALGKQSWDDSVKSLVQVPSVLAMMSEQLDWTQKLGDAVLAQQADVMDAIQRLRARARANGKLESTKEQTVTVRTEDQKQYLVIEPASPNEIYVPYYEPAVVYGDWPYPDYAPYYFPAPYGYIPGAALATGVAFAAGVAVRHAFWGNCDWGRRNINVANRNVNINSFDRSNINNFTKWEHNADHRHGVKYNNANVRQKFAKTDSQAGKAARQDFRGKDGQKVLEPDRGRPGAGDRDRPGAGDRDRPAAADRDRDRPQARDTGGRQDGSKGAAGKAAQKASPKTGQKASPQPSQKASQRPSKPQRDTAFSHVQSGPKTHAQANRGRQSVGSSGGPPRVAARGGGGRGGGGRRSDVTLKHDITLLGRLDNGLGFYRFSYNGSNQAYVGIMAQEVQTIMPEAVLRGRDGYLKVFYEKLGLKFQTYEQWIASGAQVPTTIRIRQ